MAQEETINHWNAKCRSKLVGKTIKNVRYMNDKELQEHYWDKRPLIIFFTDGTYMYSSMDDEGNDGGALFTSIDELQVIPTI